MINSPVVGIRESGTQTHCNGKNNWSAVGIACDDAHPEYLEDFGIMIQLTAHCNKVYPLPTLQNTFLVRRHETIINKLAPHNVSLHNVQRVSLYNHILDIQDFRLSWTFSCRTMYPRCSYRRLSFRFGLLCRCKISPGIQKSNLEKRSGRNCFY